MRERSQWESLEEDVIESILYKLPISSILSARAVCKSWKAKLDSSGFRELYDLNCTRENEWQVQGKVQGSREKYKISLYNASLDTLFELPFTGGREGMGWRLCDGAGGLLLWNKPLVPGMLVVGNPISNDWKELPPPPKRGRVTVCTCIVRGADAKSYKVVLVVGKGNKNGRMTVTPMVYDSQVGLWSVKKSSVFRLDSFCPYPASTEGVLYAVNTRGDYLVKYNVEMDELTCVSTGRVWNFDLYLPWIVGWKGNIYIFTRLKHETPVCVWVLHTHEWVLLSRSSRNVETEPFIVELGRRYAVSDFMPWLDGDIVKLLLGDGCVLTYNLAVVGSWSVVETTCLGGYFKRLPCVCTPLSFTATP